MRRLARLVAVLALVAVPAAAETAVAVSRRVFGSAVEAVVARSGWW